jgi:hypothetical protein
MSSSVVQSAIDLNPASRIILPEGGGMPIFPQLNRFEEATELEKCKSGDGRVPGIIYQAHHWTFIYETREEFGIGWKPFAVWPRQEEYLLFLDRAYKEFWREVVAEKCRDKGVSLLTLYWIKYHWDHDSHFHALIGTLKEEKVKLGPGHDSLFAKLRDYLETSPGWLLPVEFDLERDLKNMSLENPATRSTILGELGTEKFGRSNRGGVIFRDESAFWDDDTSENTVWTAQLNIDVSTVNGLNHFQRQAAAANSYDPTRLFVFKWQDDPRLNQEWYDENKQRAERKGQLPKFRREIDRDYHASVEGQLYPHIVNCPRGNYSYNHRWPLYTIWDYGYSDVGYVGFIQRDPRSGDLLVIDEVWATRVGIRWFVPFIPGAKPLTGKHARFRYEPELSAKILEHKTWKGRPVLHFGDPTGDKHDAGNEESVFDILVDYDIEIQTPSKAYWQDMSARQDKTAELLTRVSVGLNCEYFWSSFTQYTVPKRSENSQATTSPNKGVKKWSHAVSALEAFADCEPPLAAGGDRDHIGIEELARYSNPWLIM